MTFVIVAVTRNPKSYDSLVLKKYLMCLTGLIEFFFCCRVGTKIKYFTIILEVLLVNKVYYFYEPVAWLLIFQTTPPKMKSKASPLNLCLSTKLLLANSTIIVRLVL